MQPASRQPAARRSHAKCPYFRLLASAFATLSSLWHHAKVTKKGLSAREISWLLAQEARGAAQALRQGFEGRDPAAPSTARPSDVKISGNTPPADPLLDSLATLDDAMHLLGDLQSHRSVHRWGRIDVAALLYDLVPAATISIKTGKGTDVIGDEEVVRRMLQLLVSGSTLPLDGGQAALNIELHRDGDFVHISADLGPDATHHSALESRWLSRMATRAGGRLETSGHAHSLILPADGAEQDSEVERLRDELSQAQQQGETYARELAALLQDADSRPKANAAEELNTAHFDGAAALAQAVHLALEAGHDGAEILQLACAVLYQAQHPQQTLASLADSLSTVERAFAGILQSRHLQLEQHASLEQAPADACSVIFTWLLAEGALRAQAGSTLSFTVTQSAGQLLVQADFTADPQVLSAAQHLSSSPPPSRGIATGTPGPGAALLERWLLCHRGSLSQRLGQNGIYQLTARYPLL